MLRSIWSASALAAAAFFAACYFTFVQPATAAAPPTSYPAPPPITFSQDGWIHYNDSVISGIQAKSEETRTVVGHHLSGGGCSFSGIGLVSSAVPHLVEEETAYNPLSCEATVVQASVTEPEMAHIEALSATPESGQTDARVTGRPRTSAAAADTPGHTGTQPASGAQPPNAGIVPAAASGTSFESAHTKVIWRDPAFLTITSMAVDLSWPLHGSPGPEHSAVYAFEFPFDNWKTTAIKGPYITQSYGLYKEEEIMGSRSEAENSADWYASAHDTFHNKDFAQVLAAAYPAFSLGACKESGKEAQFYHDAKVFGYQAGPRGFWSEDSRKGACSNLVHHVTYTNSGWDGPENEYFNPEEAFRPLTAGGSNFEGRIANPLYEAESSETLAGVTSSPTVSTNAATPLSEGEASLNGALNPEGSATHYKFEYGPSESYGSATAEGEAGNGKADLYVHAIVKALTPGALYHYRLEATNTSGTSYGPDQVVRAPEGPAATTEPATEVVASRAFLNGIVDPNGIETHYHFEYGATPAYGSNTAEGDAGNGEDPSPVGFRLTGLKPKTTYYFRVVASNAIGTKYGARIQFETLPPWTIQTTANPGGFQNILFDGLNGVSCWSSTACDAAGEYLDSEDEVIGLVEQWNGTSWETQAVPSHAGAVGEHLESIACASAEACVATGYYENTPGEHFTLADRWNGTKWTVQKTPTFGTGAALPSVSCSAPKECTAVGYTVSNGAGTPLILRWNGKTWNTETVATPSEYKEGWLHGVSCSSATSCTAVGTYFTPTEVRVLAERWNGTTWSVQATPELKSPFDFVPELLGVSCPESNVCVAVGQYEKGRGKEALIERWNGSSWQLQETPNPTGHEASESVRWGLSSVSCVSASECAAVGSYKDGAGNAKPLGELWNGTAWELELPAIRGGVESNSLGAISCVEPTCIAVGESQRKPTESETLAERLELP